MAGIDDEAVWPDGEAVMPDRKAVWPDGKVVFPDGEVVFPDGETVWPDGKAVFPDGGAVFPDGEAVFPDGEAAWPDGKAVFPDEEAAWPDGEAVMPDRKIVIPDGKAVKPKGKVVFPDGEVVFPDGEAVFPNGEVVFSDGEAVMPDGEAVLPGGEAVWFDDEALLPDGSEGDAHRGKKIRWVTLCCLVAANVVLCLVLFSFPNAFPWGRRFDPPVIRGVRESLELFEDDAIQAALLEGVTSVGAEDRPDETFPVSVAVFAASGEPVREFLPGTYRVSYTSDDGAGREAEPVESVLIVKPADREGPVFEGLHDWTVTAEETVSYREGVTATDNVDGTVRFEVDAGGVDLAQPGEYTATYRAVDSRGNETVAAVHITVLEPDEEIVAGDGTSYGVNKSDLDRQADAVLANITTPDMTPRQKAWAIYQYVNGHIRYVNTSDKSSWMTAAFVGLTQGRGDCYNYFALSKELLDRAEIPNVDLERMGGQSDHYWQLVQIDGGWYHFDACPHPNDYPITSFLLTEAEVQAYSAQFSGFYANYYNYDHAACPVAAVGTPEE